MVREGEGGGVEGGGGQGGGVEGAVGNEEAAKEARDSPPRPDHALTDQCAKEAASKCDPTRSSRTTGRGERGFGPRTRSGSSRPRRRDRPGIFGTVVVRRRDRRGRREGGWGAVD